MFRYSRCYCVLTQVLSGCVESVEDHGYIVDIGIGGTKAFLPKTAAKDKQNDQDGMKVLLRLPRNYENNLHLFIFIVYMCVFSCAQS